MAQLQGLTNVVRNSVVGTALGTIRGTRRVPGGPLDAIGASVENAVSTAARIGDGARAARGALQGALLGASAAGINALDAVSDAGGGAVRGACRAGGDVAGIAALDEVRRALTGVIAGVPVSAQSFPR